MNKTQLLKECLVIYQDYIIITCNSDIVYFDRIRNKSSECIELVVNTFDMLINDLGKGTRIDVQFIRSILVSELRIDVNNLSLCYKLIRLIAPLTSS